MQDWQQLLGLVHWQGQNHNVLAAVHCAARAGVVPAWAHAAVQAVCLHANNMFVGPAQPPAPGMYYIMKCSCAHAQCCKVLLGDSVRSALLRGTQDPLACPACALHMHACRTFSVHVVKFLQIVQWLFPGACVVWDWVDVPNGLGAHFDATLVWPGAAPVAARFEVDGMYHFAQGGAARLLSDVTKDNRCNMLGVSMLRLHAQDEHVWPQKMWQFVNNLPGCVQYTASYQTCLPQQLHVNII